MSDTPQDLPQESRLHLLNNGLSTRQKKNLGQLNVTLDELNAAVQREREENERMVKWYMHQIPGLVDHIVAQRMAELCAANGLTMQGPPKDSSTGADGAVSDTGPTQGTDAPDVEAQASGPVDESTS